MIEKMEAHNDARHANQAAPKGTARRVGEGLEKDFNEALQSISHLVIISSCLGGDLQREHCGQVNLDECGHLFQRCM